MQQRIIYLAKDFKCYHFAIVDLLKLEDELGTELPAIDDHEDRVGNVGDRIQQLVMQEEPVQMNQQTHNNTTGV